MKRNRYKKFPTAIQQASLFLTLITVRSLGPKTKTKKSLILFLVILSFDATCSKIVGSAISKGIFSPLWVSLANLLLMEIQPASKLTPQSLPLMLQNSHIELITNHKCHLDHGENYREQHNKLSYLAHRFPGSVFSSHNHLRCGCLPHVVLYSAEIWSTRADSKP